MRAAILRGVLAGIAVSVPLVLMYLVVRTLGT